MERTAPATDPQVPILDAPHVEVRSAAPVGSRAAALPPGPATPERLGPLRWAVLWLAALASAGYVLWRIWNSYRFYQDDLIQFAVAQESGLSWHLLGQDVFQHFAPLNRLAHLFLVRFGGFSLQAGALLSAVLVLAFLASVLWLLHELGTSFRARLLSVVVIGLSITVLDTAVWADASLHLLLAVTATDLIIAAHLRGLRLRRSRWHVLAALFLAGGVLAQERPLFAVPLVVLVDVLIVEAGQPLRARWQLLRRALFPLAALVAVAAAAAAFIYVEYALKSAGSRPTPGTTARTALGAFTEGIGPPWLGLRLDALSSIPVQLVVLGVVLLVAALLVARVPRNADPLLFLAATFLLYYGFLAFSPILVDGLEGATALRLHNGIYLLVPTVVAVSRLRFRRGPAPDPAPARTPVESTARRWDAAATVSVAVAVVVAAGLVVTGGRFVDRTWQDERQAHAWLTEVARTEPVWSAPDATLVPLLAPPTIGRDWAEIYARQEFFLRFLRPGWVPQELGDRPLVLDQFGRPQPVALISKAAVAPTDPSGCATADRSLLEATTPATGAPLFLRLTYRTDTAAQVQLTSTAGLTPDAAATGNWAVPLEAGTHTVVIPLHSPDVEGVLLDWTGGGERCVESADVVTPVYTDGGGCTAMDVYGRPTEAVPCPVGGRR